MSKLTNLSNYSTNVFCSPNQIATAARIVNISASTLRSNLIFKRLLSRKFDQEEEEASSASADSLFDALSKSVESKRNEINELKKYKNSTLQTTTVANILVGMRGIKGLLCDTSLLDKNAGITFHGKTLDQVLHDLPKDKKSSITSPEAMFFYLLTKKTPSNDEVNNLSKNLLKRSCLPEHTVEVLESLKDVHPMTQFVSAMASLSNESLFARTYGQYPKNEMWKVAYEDSLNLISKTFSIAEEIFCMKSNNTPKIDMKSYDLTSKFIDSLSLPSISDAKLHQKIIDYFRLFFVIHSDHEGGNVSAHACTLIGSAHSDPFLSFAAGLSGLAGPLHGRANQEVLEFIDRLLEAHPNPSDHDIKDFIESTINSGKVVPGYGHAVLRVADPRCLAQLKFAEANLNMKESKKASALTVAKKMIRIAPGVLSQFEKIKNPQPNVDAISGSCLRELGFKDQSLYTVLFGVSRAIGCMANYVTNHIIGYPLERPKSLTINEIMKSVSKN